MLIKTTAFLLIAPRLWSGSQRGSESLAPDSCNESERFKFWPVPKSFKGDECRAVALHKEFRFAGYSPSENSVHVSRLQEAAQVVNSRMGDLFDRYDSVRGSDSASVRVCEILVGDPEAKMTVDPVSESYEISFNDGASSCAVKCPTAYGCIRGLFTFLQMIDPVKGFKVPSSFEIEDMPAFSHRGLLIDTSRHFIPVSMIEDHIRVMGMVKMNVLHWHIVDDHSFPLALEGEDVKLLSLKGAYNPAVVYRRADIERVVNLASSFGIRVIPEIDIPGHTTAWRKAYPELLGIAKSAIDPTREENYIFIEKVLREVASMFKQDVYEGPFVIHLGGDETWDGWDTPAIKAWMRANGMSDPNQLIQYWVSRIIEIANTIGIKVILWEDFLRSTKDSIEGFRDESNPITWQTWLRDIDKTSSLANKIERNTIFSQMFYLDHLKSRWTDIYKVDLSSQQLSSRVLGAEACMWGEWVDETNMFPRTWPRAAAVADRFWCGSACSNDPTEDAILRLSKWRCRMVELFGYKNIEPVGNQVPKKWENKFVHGTDKHQWWCDEADLNIAINQGTMVS
jgi:hexosaminidase